METKVEKHVPSFSTYSDCAVEKSHLKIKPQHVNYENQALKKMLNRMKFSDSLTPTQRYTYRTEPDSYSSEINGKR